MARIFAPPLWSQIEREDGGQASLYRTLRQVYGGLRLNGPFASEQGRGDNARRDETRRPDQEAGIETEDFSESGTLDFERLTSFWRP